MKLYFKPLLLPAAVGALTLCAANRADAWSHKEHIQFARMAAEQLIADSNTPPAMKVWLEQACPKRLDPAGEEDYFLHQKIGTTPDKVYGPEFGIVHWVFMPDIHQQNDPSTMKDPYFGVHERYLHFIDLEFFLTGDAKRAYRDDLSSKPKLDGIPNNKDDPRYQQSGFLPLRVAQCYAKLVGSIRDGKLAMTTDMDEDNAVFWAGYLAHYAADNTQPQHATVDYKSATYFKNPRTAPNVHSAVEYQMADDAQDEHAELRKEFWPIFMKQLETFVDPIKTDDPFRATCEVSSISYDALPLIGHAAAASTEPSEPGAKTDKLNLEGFFRYRGSVDGQEQSVEEMKARQTAWAVKRIERLWRQAWDEAQKK